MSTRLSEDRLNLRLNVTSAKDESVALDTRDVLEQSPSPAVDRRRSPKAMDSRPRNGRQQQSVFRRVWICLFQGYGKKLRTAVLFVLLFTLGIVSYFGMSWLLTPKLEALVVKNEELELQISQLQRHIQNLTHLSHSRKRTIESLQKQLEVQGGAEGLYHFSPPEFATTVMYTFCCMMLVLSFVIYKVILLAKAERMSHNWYSRGQSQHIPTSQNSTSNAVEAGYGQQQNNPLAVPRFDDPATANLYARSTSAAGLQTVDEVLSYPGANGSRRMY